MQLSGKPWESIDLPVILMTKSLTFSCFSGKFRRPGPKSLGICVSNAKIARRFVDNQTEYFNDKKQELRILCPLLTS